jgi:hypothetical protein
MAKKPSVLMTTNTRLSCGTVKLAAAVSVAAGLNAIAPRNCAAVNVTGPPAKLTASASVSARSRALSASLTVTSLLFCAAATWVMLRLGVGIKRSPK